MTTRRSHWRLISMDPHLFGPAAPILALKCEESGRELLRAAETGTTIVGMERRLIPRTPLGIRLVEHREAILRAATRRHASNVRVFGSVARGEDRPDSDIDLLGDVGPDATAFDLLELGCDLEDELKVRVDVGTESSLRPFLRVEVLAEALVL